MREMERKQGHDSTGCRGSSQRGNLLLGLWGSAGLGGGETEGSSTEESDIQAVPGNSEMSAEAREKGCSKQREKSVQGLVRTQRLLFQFPE